MKKIAVILVMLTFLTSCNEEVQISFEDTFIETTKEAKISIDIPRATGTASVASTINKVLEAHVANQTNMANDSVKDQSIDDAIQKFNYEYTSFKNDFPESPQQWEALIDGEVTYQTPEIISIAINSYLDTGGAHGNTVVKFFNFNGQTGAPLEKKDLINNMEAFSKVVAQRFQTETKPNNEQETMEDFFFGEQFKLPESIGFSDEGVVILYNTYEIASYAQGITEFTIPFAEVEAYLNVR
ncbi:DUF3298 and DUF4163 domain-containing protein [Sediminibacter sp. Hel_I_10]|uniref:DUF3298 and DUF4163 domain-containing protein n=1 Tax=Sediminibacter sp. Hel_I_10 TaxID=1392490 RepID=UPI00047D54FC|nr:DUF3298 and DUF4163 domain-containing protein [Sediminibacter sp. Hel_I_10]